MSFWQEVFSTGDQSSQIAAIHDAFAIIEFTLDGYILTANKRFLAMTGYTLDEIRGQHHSMFLHPGERDSAGYHHFWQNLGSGQATSGQYRRVVKGGREICLQASYLPILDRRGKPLRVMKFATDITEVSARNADHEWQLAAIHKTHAVIEFTPEGKILKANDNFYRAMGYRAEEVVGQHHGIFVDSDYRKSKEYSEFWPRLRSGEYIGGEVKRVTKEGREIWLQASYNLVRDSNGHPVKVIKFATDITQEKLLRADLSGQLAAIGKSLAVIEFTTDGRILNANQNFLDTVGYRLDEITGKHHGMFVDAVYRNSDAFRQFWEKLGRGEFVSGQYKRFTKDGREIWLQASYNPIFDMSGKPFKVIKYASDITAEVARNANFEGQMAAISRTQAVIEFDLSGHILDANDNFLKTMGYRIEDIRGKHHRMFVDPAYANSPEYRDFWARLGRGEHGSGRYMRFGAGGKRIWIQASYNPVTDRDGRPIKVVKYAVDVTSIVEEEEIQARAMDTISASLYALAEGDLSTRATGEFNVRFNGLRDTLNSSLKRLQETVTGVVEAAESIADGSAEIARGNLDLSQRTEEQASSLIETTTSMDQMTTSVKQNADNAEQVNRFTTETRTEAQRGEQVLQKVVLAMQEISAASKKMSEIISVIDSIAFQTNLLALNAAVEAARAGESGRGFAVVASEVRNLAHRSAAAAREIKALIQDSESKVAEGSTLVNVSCDSLTNIVARVQKVSDMVGQIAISTVEQSTGIVQVNKAVSDMNNMTQQNAALVEEASAASEAVSDQAARLRQMMAFFRTSTDERKKVYQGARY
jgi:methyl-accepting chemotaxis protein